METRHFLEGSLEGNLRPRKGAGVSLEDEIGETRLDLSHLSWATAFVCQLGRCQRCRATDLLQGYPKVASEEAMATPEAKG